MMKSADMNRGLKMIKKLFLGTLLILFVNLLVSWVFMTAAKGGGTILQQELDASGNGYTVMQVSGTYYEMGYAHGYLLGDKIDREIQKLKSYIGSTYDDIRSRISNTYFPPDMRDEINGIVAGIQYAVGKTIPPEDIMMLNTIGDWSYATPNCRSHSCWGSYVNSPVKSLSTRRLDFSSSQFYNYLGSQNIVLCAYKPSDSGKTNWVNLSFPGMIVAITSVNEFGTSVSIHDSPDTGDTSHLTDITRSAASRYMMTIDNLPESISQQTDFVYNALQGYVPWTGSFLNYYAPMGHAGVISCSPGDGFYNLRRPQTSYFGGEVIVTSNEFTNGQSAPSDASFFTNYYNGSKPKSLSDHWGLLDTVDLVAGAHQLSVEYRDRADMTIWFRGRLIGTATTPIIRLEWSELFEDIVISNYPPVLDPIGAKTLTEEGLLEFIITASDPDSGDILTYSADNLPPGASFDSETQLFSWTLVYGDAGNYTVTFTVTDNGTPTQTDSEEVTITVNPSSPITTLELKGTTDTEDTAFGTGSYSLLNYGGSADIFAVGNYGGVIARGLIWWDFSSILPGSTIVTAQMSLYSDSSYGGSITIDAHRLLKPWVEGTLDGQDRQLDNPDSACWPEYGYGEEWEAPGANGATDRDAAVINWANGNGTGWYSWDIRAAVQSWVDGEWVNDGLILKANNESIENMKYFVPSEGQSETLRPTLVIEYAVPAPTVVITTPVEGATFIEPAEITITADASVPGGTVEEVSFYANGTTLIGVDSTSPYSVTWSGILEGTYSLTAIAMDSLDELRTSNPVAITVYKEECSIDDDCDDGVFCNGAETCVSGACQAGNDPCPGNYCSEDTDTCYECEQNSDCDDGIFCNGLESCVDGVCQSGFPVDCDDGIACTTDSCNEFSGSCDHITNDGDCDDGIFCNGVETCSDTLGCQAGSDPCPGNYCSEDTDTCYECEQNSECDDGLFCNGEETCVSGACQSGSDPCDSSQYCNENTDICEDVECSSDEHCNDGNDCTIDTCVDGVCRNECGSTVSSYPYTEGFEAGWGDWFNLLDDDLDWTRTSGSTPSRNTGPSGAHSGSYYIYTEASSPNYPNKIALLESPCFDLSNTNDAQLTFWYHMYGTSMGTLNVEVSEDCQNWTNVWSLSGNQGNTWYQTNVDLTPYVGKTITIRFTGVTGSSYRGDMSIDDIEVIVTAANPCTVDSECDDGVFCNGAETCVSGTCQAGNDPCPGQTCDENNDECIAGPQAQLESGLKTVGGDHVTVYLANTYVSPVVVCSVQYNNNSTPVVARVTNVTPTSFEVYLQNPSDGAVLPENVSYIVVEEGVWTIDGVNIEAQTYLSTVTDENNSWVGEAQSYGQSYTNPVVIGQVMSNNDPDWSVFWCQGSSRTAPPSGSALRTGKTVCEDTDVTRVDETIGFIVIEAGHGTIGGVEFEALVGVDTIRGVTDSPPYSYSFSNSFVSAPQIAVTTLAGMDGGNGGWAYGHGANQATTTNLYLSIDEDQVNDSERNHTTEQVGYMVFETAAVYP